MEQDTISKAELARQLGCQRSRITQLSQKGMPVRSDGRLNRAEVLTWLLTYTSGAGGGWGRGHRRGEDLHSRVERLLAADAPPAQRAPAIDIESDYWRGAFAMMNALRRPGNREIIAQFCVSYGCSAWQAWAIASAYDLMLSQWGVPDGYEDAPVVEFYEGQEPDWARVAELAGEPLDLKAWERAARKRAREFNKKHPNW